MSTKIVTTLLFPPGNTVVLALLGVLLRALGRRRLAVVCWVLALCALWALSTPWLADGLVRGLEAHHPPLAPEATPRADAIVLLGGGLGPPLPPRTAPDLGEAGDRVLAAARLYRAGCAPLVVASGGYPPWLGAAGPESQATADLLVEWGVPRAAILTEGRSLDTHENAVEVARALAPRGVETILLVTSALHMPRAVATFRRAGFSVVPASTDVQSVDADAPLWRDLLPGAEALAASTRALHEHLGRLWYRVRGWAE